MVQQMVGLGRAIKFGIGMIIAGLAIINAVKAIKRAARTARER
jgi:hypothetical protein